MHPITLASRHYTHILNTIKYGCLFLFMVQFAGTLLVSQIRVSLNLGENVYLMLGILAINAISLSIFYSVTVLVLKFSLREHTETFSEPKKVKLNNVLTQ